MRKIKPLQPQKNSTKAIQTFKRNMAISFVLAFVIFNAIMLYAVVRFSANEILERMTFFVASSAKQQAMNVDNYLAEIKDTGALLFSNELYYSFDPIVSGNENIEAIEATKAISARIEDIKVLKNFSDFGIIYNDPDNPGGIGISEGTFKNLAGENIYSFFASHITDNKSNSGWFATEKNNFGKLFYVKQLNEHSILVAAIYSRELDNTFRAADRENLKIRLIDENGVTIYSNDKTEIGSKLSSFDDSNFIETSMKCSINKWKIQCLSSTESINDYMRLIMLFAALFFVVMLVVVTLISFYVLNRVYSPLAGIVTNLEQRAQRDQLTGILNKMSYTTAVKTIIMTGSKSDVSAFIMLDMDNFKNVNDTLGHKTGDDVLVRFSNLLKNMLDASFVVGRMGGDEFAIFTLYQNTDLDTARRKVTSQLETIKTEFAKEFKDMSDKCALSLSSGAVCVNNEEARFMQLYQDADEALYSSKRNGKDRYTVV